MKRMGSAGSAALLLALGTGLLVTAGAAHAQYGGAEALPELSQDWTVRVGVYVPNSKTSRQINGDVGFSGHVERRVYDAGNYEVQIGIGYNGWDRIYNVPLMANLIAKNGNIRYGFGVGYAFGKRLDGSGTSGASLGLIAGYQLTHSRNPLTGDLRYYFISGSNNELDGFSATLGIKF